MNIVVVAAPGHQLFVFTDDDTPEGDVVSEGVKDPAGLDVPHLDAAVQRAGHQPGPVPAEPQTVDAVAVSQQRGDLGLGVLLLVRLISPQPDGGVVGAG